MDNAEQQVAAGGCAERLLSNEVFSGAVASLSEHYTTQLFKTPPEAADFREALYRKHKVLAELINELQKVIDTGTVAKATLARSGRK